MEIKIGKGRLNFCIETDDLLEYYERLILLTQSLQKDDSFLTPKERKFLAHCCVLNTQGVDLSVTNNLIEYFLGIRFVSSDQQVRNYRYKMGVKGWAKTGYNIFELQPDLAEPPDSTVYGVGLRFKRD